MIIAVVVPITYEQEKEYQMLKLYTIKLMDGSENLFYLAYGMPQSRTSRRAADVVTLYPNPATTTVIISYRKELDGVFTLFNVLGEKVLQTTLSKLNSKTQIPIHHVANGVYHYEIQFGTEKKVNGKLNILK